jgi:Putative MetA-pathway of phenol degradation
MREIKKSTFVGDFVSLDFARIPMTRRTLLVIIMCFLTSTGALGQSNPWNCNSPKNNHLICLVPVATSSIGAVNSPAPAINSAFATQLSQLPLLSPATGVIFTFDKSLGMSVPSDNLGPILTERAHPIGNHKLLLAFAYQRFRFNSIDGNNLSSLPFVFEASAGLGGKRYTQETENVDFKLDQYVGLLTYGVTSRTDVSVLLPFERVSIGTAPTVTNGIPNATVYIVGASGQAQGMPATVPYQHNGGSASGVGDLLVNVKRLFWSGERSNLSAGLLLRFPTGDSLNYLGSGAFGFNPYAVFSYDARLSPHARLGYQFNTYTNLLPAANGAGNLLLPGGLQYNIGADYTLFKKVLTSVTGDLLGFYVVNSPILNASTIGAAFGGPVSLAQAYSALAQDPAIITGKTSYGSNQLSIGLKVKPVKNFLLYGNVLLQLNNVGLRSNPVPLIGASYTF